MLLYKKLLLMTFGTTLVQFFSQSTFHPLRHKSIYFPEHPVLFLSGKHFIAMQCEVHLSYTEYLGSERGSGPLFISRIMFVTSHRACGRKYKASRREVTKDT